MNATAGAVLVLTSCTGTRDDRPATTVTTGARMIMTDDAAMIMTNARCQRESVCNNVGAFRRFPSHEACKSEVFYEAHASVGDEVCPNGVHEGKLPRCLADIREQLCVEPRATHPQPASCQQSVLCTTH